MIAEAYPQQTCHFDCDQFSKYSHAERLIRIKNAMAAGDPARIESEENPRHWYGWDDINLALTELRNKGGFSYNQGWNKETGERDKNYSISTPTEGPSLVLCDGIYLLHPPVRHLLDVTLYVDVPFSVTIDRGQRRMRDSERTSYMEKLHRTYSLPYFAEHASETDWIYADESAQ